LQRYTKEVQIVIAATAATPRTMDEKEIERRKRRRITDDDDNDDDNDDDDDKDDYDKEEDEDDESSNDVDNDEVGDKSSNPLVNVARGCNSPPPPLAQGKAPSSSHGGKKRSRSNAAIVPLGGERQPQRGINPNKRGGKKKEKKRRNTSSSPPHVSFISRNSSSNTVGTFDSPPFVSGNVGPEAFSNDVTDNEYMYSYCQVEHSACSYDPHNPSLPFLYCEHRFCRDCIETMKGGQDCPVNDCRGKIYGKF